MKAYTVPAAAILLLAACASSTASNTTASQPSSARAADTRLADPETPAGNPANYIGDARLYQILARTPLDSSALAALSEYEYQVGTIFMDRVGEVAEDSNASVAARVNALKLIGERMPARQYVAVKAALGARDPRVRASALAAANRMHTAGVKDAAILIRSALYDAAPEIQVKALQFVGVDDIDLLRRVAAVKSTSPEVAGVIREMIQVAEERGSPVQPVDTAKGLIERVSASGNSLRFVPTTQWKQWQAAVGRVTIRTAEGRRVELPGDIEMVRNVVPVFFSADGRYVVYETGRTIRVRDLVTDADRLIGEGVAPRVLPVTGEFIFVREDLKGRAVQRDRTRVRYNVYAMAFNAPADATPKMLGSANGFIQQGIHGNYSPVRWMRIEDRNGLFYLTGDTIEMFALPDAFTSGAGS